MARALVEWLQTMIPGERLDGLVVSLIRFFCGDRTADGLGLAVADWTQGVVRPLRKLVGLFDQTATRSQVLARLTEHLGWALLEGWLYVGGEGEPVQVHIPRALRSTWQQR